METCLKESSTTDIYVQEAAALAKGKQCYNAGSTSHWFYGRNGCLLCTGIDSGIYRITEVFQSELSVFTFPPDIKTALLAYASFDV